MEHKTVVHPMIDGHDRKRRQLLNQPTFFSAGDPQIGDRRLQLIHGDVLKKNRADQMERSECTLRPFKIQDPEQVCVTRDHNRRAILSQLRKITGGVIVISEQRRDMR